MKKLTKVVLACASIFSLVACGEQKPETIDNATAAKRLQAVTEEMGKAAGFKVEGSESVGLSIHQLAYTDTDGTQNKATELSVSSTGAFGLELLLEEGMPTAGKATATLTSEMKSTEEEEEGKADVALEGYLKDKKVYGKVHTESTVNDGTTEDTTPEVTDKTTGMDISAYIDNAGDILDSMKDMSITDILTTFVGIEIDESTKAMIDSYINAIQTKLPNCNVTTNKKTDTFSWKLTNNDIDNMIDAAILSSLPPLEDSGLTEEQYNAAKETLLQSSASIKTMVASILKINNAEFKLSIYDEKYISSVELDLDIDVAIPESLGLFPADTTFKLDLNVKGEISLLDSNYSITYPSDLESWMPAPETDDNTESN